jgi:hypothetical protein
MRCKEGKNPYSTSETLKTHRCFVFAITSKSFLEWWKITVISKHQAWFIPIAFYTRQVDQSSWLLISPRLILCDTVSSKICWADWRCPSPSNLPQQLSLISGNMWEILFATIFVFAHAIQLKCGYDCRKFTIGCKLLLDGMIGYYRVEFGGKPKVHVHLENMGHLHCQHH